MNLRRAFFIFGVSLLLFLLLSPLRAVNIQTSSLIGFVAYLYLTIFCLNKYKDQPGSLLVIASLIAGLWALMLPIRIFDFTGTLVTLPDSILHTSGIICGALYWQIKNPFRYFALILFCVFNVFMYFQGFDYWLHKLNFGTFTGNVSYMRPAKFEAFTRNGDRITDSDFENKIVLLDFWNTTCGICFRKFPRLQALHDKYKDDPSVMILAINGPLEEDKPGQAFQIIEERGYTFPVLIPEDRELPVKFGVLAYPRTFILVNNEMIVFDGDIDFVPDKLEKLRSGLR